MKKRALVISYLLTAVFCYADPIPNRILGGGVLSRDYLIDFLLFYNPALDVLFALDIVDLYITESYDEGVNYDIAFAQMCYHTNYLTFNRTFAEYWQNNFYGCSSRYNSAAAASFRSVWEGVRAHIQHLKGYASRSYLVNDCVDPRYYIIEEEYGLGSSPTIDGLSYKWVYGDYAFEIKSILANMYRYYYGQVY